MKPAQDEDLDLKRRARRRLIGAIALVLFLVIVPPWVMELEPRPVQSTLEVDIPPRSGSLVPAPVPPAPIKVPQAEVPKAPESAPAAAEPAQLAEVPKVEAPKAEAPKAEPPKSEMPKVEPPKTEAPKTATAPEAPKVEAAKLETPKTATSKVDTTKAPAPAAAPATTTKQYVVPIATLSNKGNVKTLQSKLSKAGVKSYTESVKTSAGEQTRVRAGPFPSKEAAVQAHRRLTEIGEKPGNVIAK